MHSVILESLNAESDLKAIIGAICNILNVDKKQAVEYAKQLPLVLAENIQQKEAKLMADMFSSMGAGIKVVPPLKEENAKPIRHASVGKKGMPLKALIFIMLCLIGFATFASLKYEWIVKQLSPSPEKAEKLLQKGNMTQARKNIAKQLNKNPTSTELLTLQGKFYIGVARKKMDKDDWKTYGEAGALPELDSAIAFFRKAESLDPNDSSIPRWISTTEQMRRNFAEAEIAARRAVSINSQDSDNWNQLGSVLVEEEKISQAEQVFTNALKVSPNNATSLKNLAILNLYYTKDAERASKYLFAFLNKKEAKSDMDSYMLRTDLTTAMIGDFNLTWEKLSPPAIPFQEYEKRRLQITKNPKLKNNSLLQEQLGLLFMSEKEFSIAESHFIRAVQLDKNMESSRKMLAVIYLKDAAYDKALKIMQASANNNSKDPFFWKNIGVLQKYFKANQIDALKAFNHYLALGGDSFIERVKKEVGSK